MSRKLVVLSLWFAAIFPLSGCSDFSPFTGEMAENQPPVVELSFGPVENDSLMYQIHFYWIGDDPDGDIDHYEVLMVDGDPIGFDPSDTTGLERWTRTVATDTLILASSDIYDTVITINESRYAVYERVHTFFIRAIDNRGGQSETVYRSFTSWTLAPHIVITDPLHINPNKIQSLGPKTHFRWYGKDPIDSPWNYQDVDSVRYLLAPYNVNVVRDLNRSPEEFEHLWSRWIHIDAPGDSGRWTIMGDDEIIPTGRTYIFAVQAMDEAGAVSSVFDTKSNVRAFIAKSPTGPFLTIREHYLGTFHFLGHDLDPILADVPPGFEMRFRWEADASHYGSIVSTFRYGWDIVDFNDPAEWETTPLPDLTSAVPKTFYSGIHTLYVEVTDDLGVSTLSAIQIRVIPVVMSNDLLWIDDLPSTNFLQSVYAFPTEAEHDGFWTDLCLRARDFNPTRDIYDVSEHAFQPPPLDLLFRYKNVIWTYSPALDGEQGSLWTKLIRFDYFDNFNFIPYYLLYGGHIWTCGPSQRTGGLAAVLTSGNRIYPCDLKCDLLDPSPDCSNRAGIHTMVYKDYCVSVIDKVDGSTKPWIPFIRDRDRDALSFAEVSIYDPVTLAHPGLPPKLELWDMVTQPGMFFDPTVMGFTYVEVYDPAYWMGELEIEAQECLHPMYVMKTRNPRSVLNGQTIAFWMTKYADVVSPGGINCAAPSVHFGFPPWFFDRAQIDSIADVIFGEWQILGPAQSDGEKLLNRKAPVSKER